MFKHIGRLFERKSAVDITALLAAGTSTASGIAVSAETALRCPAVFGATKVLAETVGQLPLHLYRRLPDGGRERAEDHSLCALLTDAPNAWTTASEFRMSMQAALTLHGNAFAWIGRDGQGRPVEMIQLDSRSVSVETDAATMEPRYVVTDANGTRREYSRADVLHLRTFGAKPHVGDSPVMQGREAIGLALTLEKHGAGLFGRGARPAGVLKYPGKLTEDLFARLRRSFESMHGGSDNAGRTAILEDGVTFEPLQLSSVDAQFLEMRKFQLQEVARLFRVPLHMLNDLERVTHSNAEQMGQQFLTYCLLPILKLWQDAIRLTLLAPEERGQLYAEFLVDDLARADLAARFTAYSQAISAGVLNPNEVRAMENRGPYSGGEVYMRPVNTAPAPTNSNGGTDED